MSDCTHGPPTPCAGCRILAAGYDAARPGAVPAWRTRVLMEAHAAAARREALESAAQWADEWLRRDQKAIASSHCGRYIRARAAEAESIVAELTNQTVDEYLEEVRWEARRKTDCTHGNEQNSCPCFLRGWRESYRAQTMRPMVTAEELKAKARREAFEEANAKAHSGCGISAFFDWLGARAAEEGDDER